MILRRPVRSSSSPPIRAHLARLAWAYGPVGVGLRLKPIRSFLQPDQFRVFAEALAERRGNPGAVVEVGCYRGGTSVQAERLLRLWGDRRAYVCVDTFAGFVPQHVAQDDRIGLRRSMGTTFSFNSPRMMERIFRHFGSDIEIVEGDIATLPVTSLPAEISVCLLDVDLAVPTLEGLRRIYPRLVPGGVALVDDCEGESATRWPGARHGYRQFVEEIGLPERYNGGLGVIEKPAPTDESGADEAVAPT